MLTHSHATVIRRRAAARTAGGARGNDVWEAIEAYFAARADLKALLSDGKLWLDEAPQGTVLPYATFTRVSEVMEDRTTAFRKFRAIVQFSLHHWTPKRAKDLCYAFETAFTGAPLVAFNTPVLHCLPGNPLSALGEGKGDRGRDCRIEMIEFEILYTK